MYNNNATKFIILFFLTFLTSGAASAFMNSDFRTFSKQEQEKEKVRICFSKGGHMTWRKNLLGQMKKICVDKNRKKEINTDK